jgi:hypothetical protein
MRWTGKDTNSLVPSASIDHKMAQGARPEALPVNARAGLRTGRRVEAPPRRILNVNGCIAAYFVNLLRNELLSNVCMNGLRVNGAGLTLLFSASKYKTTTAIIKKKNISSKSRRVTFVGLKSYTPLLAVCSFSLILSGFHNLAALCVDLVTVRGWSATY